MRGGPKLPGPRLPGPPDTGNLIPLNHVRWTWQTSRPTSTQILAVDDDPASLQLLLRLLDPSRYTLRTALSTAEALTALDADDSPPDLLILDVNLPQTDGLSLAAALRQRRALARCPLLFITGDLRTETVERCLALAPADYIAKPVRAVELQARIQALIRAGEQQRALRMQSAWLRQLLDRSTDLVEVHGVDGRIRYANLAFCDFVGRSPAEVLGERIDALIEPMEGNAGPSPLLSPMNSSSLYRALSAPLKTRILRGQTSWVEPEHQDTLRGVFHDVSDLLSQQHSLEAERATLTAANRSLQRAVATRDELVRMVSHQLRSPLTNLLGLLDQIERSPHLPEPLRPALRQVSDAGSGMVRLVNELLTLSRLRAGSARPDLSWVAVHEIVRGLLLHLGHLAQRRRMRVEIDVQPEDLVVRTDGRWLRQTYLALLDNAIKYGHAAGTIRLRARHEGGALYLEVKDDGPGIPLADQRRVFEPMVQLPRPDGHPAEGTGLGLALVRQMVAALGGSLELESALGQGCAFRARIPAELL